MTDFILDTPFGDKLRAEPSGSRRYVYVYIKEGNGGRGVPIHISPKNARQFAEQLVQAADQAEAAPPGNGTVRRVAGDLLRRTSNWPTQSAWHLGYVGCLREAHAADSIDVLDTDSDNDGGMWDEGYRVARMELRHAVAEGK